MRVTVGSLFTGIGGIDLAAEWAGMEVIWQCEIDLFCQKVLQKHWPGVKLYDDIRKIGGAERPDVIVGGFPCQPYSIAGKRGGKEDDRDLWPEMFRVIQETKPTWVVGENVANFVNMELERTLLDLESIGYETQTFIIPACSVNAKHQRNRVIIVAHTRCSLLPRELLRKSYEKQDRKRYADKIERSGEMVFDSDGFRCQKSNDEARNIEKRERKRKPCSTNGTPGHEWKPEPNVGRVANGIPNRVDRLRGLGNAVVPQQIYPILKAVYDIEVIKCPERKALSQP
jgi:DNA (cytosine-5)-methyltransferase 1